VSQESERKQPVHHSDINPVINLNKSPFRDNNEPDSGNNSKNVTDVALLETEQELDEENHVPNLE
jgi:hypothetical protein